MMKNADEPFNIVKVDFRKSNVFALIPLWIYHMD